MAAFTHQAGNFPTGPTESAKFDVNATAAAAKIGLSHVRNNQCGCGCES